MLMEPVGEGGQQGRGQLRWLTVAVALVSVAAVVAGVLGTARAMFLSQHDLEVIGWVAVVAGAVAVAVGVLVGATVSRWSGLVRDEARRFGQSGEFVASTTGTAGRDQSMCSNHGNSQRQAIANTSKATPATAP